MDPITAAVIVGLALGVSLGLELGLHLPQGAARRPRGWRIRALTAWVEGIVRGTPAGW